MKKIIKSNYKLFVGVIIGLLLSAVGVYAAGQIFAVDIVFNNSNSNLKSTNVQGAIEEIYGKVGNDTCGNVAEPVLKDELIPVTIADDGKVTYADTSKEWFNYCKKQWANAVILKSNPSKEYHKEEIIEESDIESYFVWIPKYRYKLWNVGTTDTLESVHSIEIEFNTENTTNTGTTCETPMLSGESGACQNGMYMTHPAFISMNVNGIWVGKFELTGSVDHITVKPNEYSLTNQTVQTYFNTMKNYKTNLDSHMMKNTEWGAVAYLSHSKYGINREININNSWNGSANRVVTGKSSLLTIQQGTYPAIYGDGESYNKSYNTKIGYLASTTGNISGIYDMSGGTYEYMAAYHEALGSPSSADLKYLDIYKNNSTETTYNNRILGDATGELGPFADYKDTDQSIRHHSKWYGDGAYIVSLSFPYVNRGGASNDGILAGGFVFYGDTGKAALSHGTRLVLTVK